MLVQGIKSRPEYKGLDHRSPTQSATSSSSKAKGRPPSPARWIPEGQGFSGKIGNPLSGPQAPAPKAYDVVLSALSPDIFWQGRRHFSRFVVSPALPVWSRPDGNAALHRRHRRLYRPDHADGAGIRYRFQLDPYRTSRLVARRVQCVHCKAITVTSPTHPVTPHCGLSLLVRDHYPRRLGAFRASVSMPKNRVRRLRPMRCSREPHHSQARAGHRVTDVTVLVKRFRFESLDGVPLPAFRRRPCRRSMRDGVSTSQPVLADVRPATPAPMTISVAPGRPIAVAARSSCLTRVQPGHRLLLGPPGRSFCDGSCAPAASPASPAASASRPSSP